MFSVGTCAQTQRQRGMGSSGCTNKQTKQKTKIKPVGIVGLVQRVLEFSSNMHHWHAAPVLPAL